MIRPGIELGNASDVGQVRTENEDYFGYFEPDSDELYLRLGRLIVVADGMGGEVGGFTASRMAVDIINETYYGAAPELDVPEALRIALSQANRQVHQRGLDDTRFRGMGTTAVALALLENEAYVAHVGDSRGYLVREGVITQLTDDHTMVNRLVKAGTITKEEAEDHPDANVITRSIGSKAEVEVEVSGSLPVMEGDRYVLCSDGLYGLVEDQEISGTVSSVHPMDACSALVALANQRGGHDNVTVQTVLVGQCAPPVGTTTAPRPKLASSSTIPPSGKQVEGKKSGVVVWIVVAALLLLIVGGGGLGLGLWLKGGAGGAADAGSDAMPDAAAVAPSVDATPSIVDARSPDAQVEEVPPAVEKNRPRRGKRSTRDRETKSKNEQLPSKSRGDPASRVGADSSLTPTVSAKNDENALQRTTGWEIPEPGHAVAPPQTPPTATPSSSGTTPPESPPTPSGTPTPEPSRPPATEATSTE